MIFRNSLPRFIVEAALNGGVIKSYYPLSLLLLSFLWRLKLQFVFVSTFVECSLVDRYGFVEDSFIA